MSDEVDFAACMGEPGPTWQQGDIVDGAYFAAVDAEVPAVLVTPACDIEQVKVDIWTLVALLPEIEVVKAFVAPDLAAWRKTGSGISRAQRQSLDKTIRGLLTHRHQRYHWLPLKIGSAEGYVADFTLVTSLPIAEVQRSNRIASLRSSWREQLPSRYAAYMARVGTLDFKPEAISERVTRLVEAVAGN